MRKLRLSLVGANSDPRLSEAEPRPVAPALAGFFVGGDLLFFVRAEGLCPVSGIFEARSPFFAGRGASLVRAILKRLASVERGSPLCVGLLTANLCHGGLHALHQACRTTRNRALTAGTPWSITQSGRAPEDLEFQHAA